MEGETTKQHKKDAPKNISCAIITLSDSRTLENDESGCLIKELLEKEGHRVIKHLVIPDDKDQLLNTLNQTIPLVKVIITNGGTGISKRDITIDVIDPLYQKRLVSFNSLFAMLSYQDVGSSALVSRASAGIIQSTVVFCLPGSPKAVSLGVTKLIIPELGHIVKHLT